MPDEDLERDVELVTAVLHHLMRAGLFTNTERGLFLAKHTAIDLFLAAHTGQRYDEDDEWLSPDRLDAVIRLRKVMGVMFDD